LAGRLPFESNDPMQLVLMHRSTPPPPLTQFRHDVPAMLESTAAAALSKDPSERPPDGGALLAELGAPVGSSFAASTTAPEDDATRVLPAPPAGIGAPSSEPYPEPPAASRRTLLIVGALLVLALAGGALAYEVTRPDSSPAPPVTIPSTTPSTRSTRHATTAAGTTAPSTESTTQQTTTQHTTTQQTQPTTTASPPPTKTAPPPTTAPTTTAPPPTTDTTTTSAAPAPGVSITVP